MNIKVKIIAAIKVKIIVGRYYLQVDRARIIGGVGTCPLFSEEDEDLERMILRCPKLEVRIKHLPKILKYNVTGLNTQDDCMLLAIILDPDRAEIALDVSDRITLERLSRQFFYALDYLCTVLLKTQ